jgi:hypothetical protein
MSDAMTVPAPPRRGYPPAIGNLLASWWLALGFWVLLLAILWPEMPLPGALNAIKTGMLTGIVLILLVLGTIVAWGIAAARPGMLRVMKLALLIGMGLGVVVVGVFFVAKMRAGDAAPSPHPPLTFLGPNPVVAGALLGLAGLLPFLFALFALSFTTSDEVTHHFYPPAEEHTAVTRPVVMAREEAAALAAEEEAAAEAEALAAAEAAAAAEAERAAAEAAAAEAAAAEAAAEKDHDAPLAVDSDLDLFVDDDKDKK